MAWLLPVIGVLAALAVVFAIIRSMASRGEAETATEPAPEDDLGPYLEAVDRDLGLDLGLLASPGGSNPTARADRAEIPPPEEGLSKDV